MSNGVERRMSVWQTYLRWVLIFFSMIFGIVKFVAIIGLIIWGIVKLIKLIKKNGLVKNKKPLVLSIICIIIATASLVLNMGWIRFGMIFMLIPIIQPILFLITNLYVSQFFC